MVWVNFALICHQGMQMRKIGWVKKRINWLRLVACCGFGLAAVASPLALCVSPAQAAFGISSLSTGAANEDGTPDLQAGSHPFAYSFAFAMNTNFEGMPEGGLRGVEVDLPPGLVGDPGAVPRCSSAEFDGRPRCPSSSQVGIVEAEVVGLGTVVLPLYNLTPPPGYVASFGGAVEGNSFVELLTVAGSGAGAHIHLRVPLLPMGNTIVRVAQTLWGVPADPGHDAERGECLENGGTCPTAIAPAALLTLPVRCGGPPVTTVTASSVEEPGQGLTATAEFLDQANNPHGLVGCDGVSFAPTFALNPEGGALSPSGLHLDLHLPLSEQPYGSAAGAVRELTLDLPPGLVVNPSAASGLEACSPAQIGLGSEPGEPARFDATAPACPGGSRVGTIDADLPALGEVLSGTVYLATPAQNLYATTFVFYAVLEDPARGLEIKIPARFEADSGTGRLTASITDLPEFPFADVSLHFPSGPRALFATPPRCGNYVSTGELVPSTAPEGPAARVQSGFTLGSGPEGCPPAEPGRPVSPSFEAGTTSPIAGSSSSFVLKLARTDLDQHFGSFDITLPPGLTANLGSTPVGTAVGSVQVQAGLGSQPLALQGTAYLAGPYRGFPYSLEFVVPAQAGPFDLGRIVERAALDVDPETAQISLRSDPLPQILSGVPLEVRSLTVDLDHAGFIRNPTSCEPMAITGSATSAIGQAAALLARFQVGACAALSFKPKLSLRLFGSPGRGGHPGVRAVMSDGEGEATPANAGFTLPAGELLDLRRIRALCPPGVPADRCPRSSRLGSVTLKSSFLPESLTGSLYLRVPSHRLPDLAAALHSPSGSLEFALRGRTTDAHGRLGVKLESLPDVPLSTAVIELAAGRGGIFVNSRSLCGRQSDADVSLNAHNGMRRQVRVPVRVGGCR
jgi:hypothetical protein